SLLPLSSSPPLLLFPNPPLLLFPNPSLLLFSSPPLLLFPNAPLLLFPNPPLPLLSSLPSSITPQPCCPDSKAERLTGSMPYMVSLCCEKGKGFVRVPCLLVAEGPFVVFLM